MAFQQSTIFRQIPQQTLPSQGSSALPRPQPVLEQSQEWVLFSPSQAESSTDRTQTTRTAGLSRISDLGSLNTGARSGPLESIVLEEETEDGELDSLDDGLHAFREPPTYPNQSNQITAPVLPTHDGLGAFQASSSLVLEQLWQHEQHNPKRKHQGNHRRPSSVQRRLDTVEELEAQASEEKRVRIEKWRLEQSQALLEEVEKVTRRQMRRESSLRPVTSSMEAAFGSTPKQTDYIPEVADKEVEPFWRRLTRKFIRDVIGIDEPLLSVILGESLPGEATPRPSSPVNLPTIPEIKDESESDQSWRDRLLQRIAKELGVFVHQISPHPGAFSTAMNSTPDYAGMPIRPQLKRSRTTRSSGQMPGDTLTSAVTPRFSPTLGDQAHAESWGFEDEPSPTGSNATLDLRQEREFWERELDMKLVIQFLKDRFTSTTPEDHDPFVQTTNDSSASRAAIIRQHHPLVARAHRSNVRVRRDSRLALRRAGSSCASESAKSGHRNSIVRSGSSRNYWDIGGSVGSGSLMASGGLMGAWGEV